MLFGLCRLVRYVQSRRISSQAQLDSCGPELQEYQLARTRRPNTRLVPFLAASFLAAGLLIAPPASAEPTTIHVRATSCSDSGPGTAGQPFCTIQHALDIVQPGQTVALHDSATLYETPTLTRSGTEDAPITITSVDGAAYVWASAGPVFTISGAHDIVVRGVEFHAGGASSAEAIVLDNASRITLDQLVLVPKAQHPGLRATNSSVVTVSRSNVAGAVGGVGIHATQGSSELTLAGNTITYGVVVDGFTNLAIAGNRLYQRCGPALTVAGPADAVSIQNNVFVRSPAPTCPVNHFVEVDTAAAPTTTLDYNNITHAADAYLWAGTSYDSPADLHSATGQAAHDLIASRNSLTSLYDNANADAPGALIETAVDLPSIPNTGAGTVTYLDRGPYEYDE
ncbi:right-handed parallel beta-helix repeat-containing protein [Actinophytocola glycyrrhizae]|uniref:Right-handed parallel beta-helix repeat-containing protein n=1 Tax=Actinophytocola glycyrrhizae TaxID=2044873 RepID=A0ABV9SCB9_9PSEU